MRKIKPEQLLAARLASYLKMNYPDVIFRFDLAADMPLPPHLAKRGKELHGKFNRGYPDLFVARCTKKFGGLYLELKAGASIPDTEHTRRQAAYHVMLRAAGYKVCFCLNYEECTKKVRKYLKKAVSIPSPSCSARTSQ